MKTELQRHMPGPASFFMGIVFKPPKFGAYSELFGLLSPDVTLGKNGSFVIPWGRFGCLPDDIKASLKDEQHGGTGVAQRFFGWCERETKQYM
jgi:retinol dehydrogenase-12